MRTLHLVPVVVLVLGSVAAVPLARADTSSGPTCDAAFDPYGYSQTAVTGCGYQTFPRTGTESLAGGGTSYDYTVDGMQVQFYVPPAGFDPATASDAQLDEYGFPPRPAAGSSDTTWSQEMSDWTQSIAPPEFLERTNDQSLTKTSGNWSGYAITGNPGSFTHAEAWYSEPTISSSVCPTTAESAWAGIGGFSTSPLAQAGTAWGQPGIGNHQAWWEILPSYAVPVPLYATAGQPFDASVRKVTGGYRFWLENLSNGNTVAFNVASASYDGTSAEAVVERPSINGVISNLANYGTMTFIEAEANGAYFSDYNPDTRRYGIHMYDKSGNLMADVDTTVAFGSFTDTQHSCF